MVRAARACPKPKNSNPPEPLLSPLFAPNANDQHAELNASDMNMKKSNRNTSTTQ
jgi:hypothetical protein